VYLPAQVALACCLRNSPVISRFRHGLDRAFGGKYCGRDLELAPEDLAELG